jgi:phospholipase/lecithinase/hemolysin
MGYATLLAVMATPQEYRFTNRDAPCLVDDAIQADPNQSIFWDAYHYTSAMHRLIAQQFYETLMG